MSRLNSDSNQEDTQGILQEVKDTALWSDTPKTADKTKTFVASLTKQ